MATRPVVCRASQINHIDDTWDFSLLYLIPDENNAEITCKWNVRDQTLMIYDYEEDPKEPLESVDCNLKTRLRVKTDILIGSTEFTIYEKLIEDIHDSHLDHIPKYDKFEVYDKYNELTKNIWVTSRVYSELFDVKCDYSLPKFDEKSYTITFDIFLEDLLIGCPVGYYKCVWEKENSNKVKNVLTLEEVDIEYPCSKTNRKLYIHNIEPDSWFDRVSIFSGNRCFEKFLQAVCKHANIIDEISTFRNNNNKKKKRKWREDDNDDEEW